jgi:ribosome-binding factor A
MASKRIARLNEQLRRELSELLRTSVRDPRVKGVTVTAVHVASDLATAKVHVRLHGEEADRRAGLEGLHAAAPFLRHTLGRALHVRRIPEFHFLEDTSLEQAQRIEAILAEVLPHGPLGDAVGEGVEGGVDAGREEAEEEDT